MRRKFITLLAITATLLVSSQELTHYEFDVQDFTDLRVLDGLNVDYKSSTDSVGKAVFTAPSDIASVLMFDNNRKGRLDIKISTPGVAYDNLPTITVYSQFLSSVENSGDSTVRVLTIAPAPNFKAKVIGNGRIVARDIKANQVDASLSTGSGQLVLYGQSQLAKLNLTGTGSIQADELSARIVKCRLMGTGTIGCRVAEELNVVGAGTGKVYYAGSPETIKARPAVGIKVISLDDPISDKKK